MDGGTGSPSASASASAHGSAHASASASPASASALGPAETAEMYGNLHEYGSSLGVDLEEEEHLMTLVQEAFEAPLPCSWTEYMDESGRAYYVKEGRPSTWEHPMDQVYRELLGVIRQASSTSPAKSREELVQEHLRETHELAKEDLSQWTGPYVSDQGEYYYNDHLKVSTWESPVKEWENELATRHSVLDRYLLLPQLAKADAKSPDMLQALRLQLGNLHVSQLHSDAPEPSTCRSYHTARSARSGTSGRSERSKQSLKKERKEQKSKRGDDRLDDLPESSSPER